MSRSRKAKGGIDIKEFRAERPYDAALLVTYRSESPPPFKPIYCLLQWRWDDKGHPLEFILCRCDARGRPTKTTTPHAYRIWPQIMGAVISRIASMKRPQPHR